ncbi:Glutathione gamma-glutamylcysteinyltransferase 3 [Schistosoma japonicum]|nr:Glutathione gamma-glutamylcysteinyltransferase 3 [Schistosoma japonicum]KAH8850268.1 Glutathione gamma-glutamylcysteinyltransferase 3 [Schistosoma japonicum]
MNATQSFPEFYKSLKLGRIWSTFGVIKFSQIFGRLFLLNRQIYSFHNSVPLVKSNIILLSSIQSMSSSCNTTKFHTDVTSGVQQFYRRPLPRHCIPFSSPEGKRIFREALLSGHMETYFCLASQFCTQEEPSYCGLASLVMVLNALGIDPGRVWKSPWRWYHESMLTCCLPQDVLTKGITLDDFVRIARCYGLDVDLHRISSDTSLSHFRDIVMKMTSGSSKGYLVVCYSRSALGQTGTGHFAPVGGYHPERELVFLFDTARFKYPPHWVSLTKLWISMNQVDSDTQLPRGFVVLRKAAVPISTEQLVKAQKELRLSFSRETDNDYQDQSPSGSGLRLFSISDCAYQAYSSPSALLDPHSTGYKLKSLVNLWVSWLKCDSEIFADLPAHFLYEALTFLFDEIDRLKPTSFFFVIHPLTSSLPDGNELNNIDGELVNFSTHDILRDIVGSSLGRIVTDFMLKMNQEYFAWLTTDGTFRLTIPTPDSWTKRTDDCPFTVLSDPGLRFCLLTTSFLLAFPYDLFISNSLLFNNSVSSHLSSPTSSKSRLQIMKKSIDDVKLLPATYAELHSLRNLLKSLMNVNDNLSCTRCINH